MRKLTVLLSFILLLMLAFAGYFYAGGTLRAQPYVQTAAAADYPEAFAYIRSLIASGAAIQVFDDTPLAEDPSLYTLADITVSLSNRGLFPAEWLDVRANAAPGDIAVYALTGEGGNVDARGAAQVNLKLITTARADAPRSIAIQYYVHGMKREITVTV